MTFLHVNEAVEWFYGQLSDGLLSFLSCEDVEEKGGADKRLIVLRTSACIYRIAIVVDALTYGAYLSGTYIARGFKQEEGDLGEGRITDAVLKRMADVMRRLEKPQLARIDDNKSIELRFSELSRYLLEQLSPGFERDQALARLQESLMWAKQSPIFQPTEVQ